MLSRMLDNFLNPWRLYADFSGRASRSEFWTFSIACGLIGVLLSELSAALRFPFVFQDYGLLDASFQLAVLVPSIAVTTRRLHDVNKSGWWQLIGLVPLIGWLVLFIDLIGRPTRGANRFGSNPYGDPVVRVPEDGGPPYVIEAGRFSECPHCGQRNPRGRAGCQWCHKAYRECPTPV